MIWLFIVGGVYSIVLLTVSFTMGWKLRGTQKPEAEQSTSTTQSLTKPKEPQSGALKSMTALERSLEDSKELKERVEYLLK